jgi:hypothetical protein
MIHDDQEHFEDWLDSQLDGFLMKSDQDKIDLIIDLLEDGKIEPDEIIESYEEVFKTYFSQFYKKR